MVTLDNISPNFNKVVIGELELYFSYETIIAFSTKKSGLVVSENIWSNTTGKHLNWILVSKNLRVNHSDFKNKLNETLKEFNLMY